MRRGRIGFAVLLCVTVAGAAESQPIYLTQPDQQSCSNGCSGQLLTVDLTVPAILGSITVPFSNTPVYFTPDGAYLLWLQTARPAGSGGESRPAMLGMFDVATRTSTLLPLPVEAVTMVGHPRRPEVFFIDAAGVVSLSLAGVRRLSGSCVSQAQHFRGLSINANGSRVLYSCGAFDAADIIDTDSGAIVASVTLAGSYPALSNDGGELYRAETAGPTAPTFLRRYAVGGGPPLAEREIGVGRQLSSIAVDPRTGRVFIVDAASVAAFDGITLQPIGSRIYLPNSSPYGGIAGWTFDPALPFAYVTSSWLSVIATPSRGYDVINTDTLAVTLSIRQGSNNEPAGRFLVPPRPAAPLALAATVQNGSVELTWSGGASNATTLRYLVEAGTAPGLANIGSFDVGLMNSLAVGAVPAGTYYVRVRAANVSGSSPPSNEIVVTVP